jgi:hypothetical protein
MKFATSGGEAHVHRSGRALERTEGSARWHRTGDEGALEGPGLHAAVQRVRAKRAVLAAEGIEVLEPRRRPKPDGFDRGPLPASSASRPVGEPEESVGDEGAAHGLGHPHAAGRAGFWTRGVDQGNTGRRRRDALAPPRSSPGVQDRQRRNGERHRRRDRVQGRSGVDEVAQRLPISFLADAHALPTQVVHVPLDGALGDTKALRQGAEGLAAWAPEQCEDGKEAITRRHVRRLQGGADTYFGDESSGVLGGRAPSSGGNQDALAHRPREHVLSRCCSRRSRPTQAALLPAPDSKLVAR